MDQNGTDEIEVNERGGVNSKILGGWTDLDYRAIRRLLSIIHYGGQKYGYNTWRLDSVETNLDHCIEHLTNYLDELKHRQALEVMFPGSMPDWEPLDPEKDELGHAFCRLYMAVAAEMQRENLWREVLVRNRMFR